MNIFKNILCNKINEKMKNLFLLYNKNFFNYIKKEKQKNFGYNLDNYENTKSSEINKRTDLLLNINKLLNKRNKEGNNFTSFTNLDKYRNKEEYIFPLYSSRNKLNVNILKR